MRLLELHLKAFGPFTDQVLPLGGAQQRLVLVHGLNEAGKSSALRAIAGLRFGIPDRSPDNFVHPHPQMRVGGVFVDAQGRTCSLMRRKGRGVTLHFADFGAGGAERPEPVPAALGALLTGGLSVAEYQTMFGIDHAALRRGGAALASGDGETGAALFEASSGAAQVGQILEALDDAARKYFIAGGNARNARINQALSALRERGEEQRRLQVRPTSWERLDREAREARAVLDAAEAEHRALSERQLLVKELLAVSPALAALTAAEAASEAQGPVRLLSEDAASLRASAAAGLSDARADAQSADAAAAAAQSSAERITPDGTALAAGAAIAQLHAAVPVIAQLQTELGQAGGDVEQRTAALERLAAAIDPTRTSAGILALAPGPTACVELTQALGEMESAASRRALHLESAPAEGAAEEEAPAQPDAAAAALLRVVLAEVARADARLERLAMLPREIEAAERRVAGEIAALGLADESALARVTPLLGAVVDEELALRGRLATQRGALEERIGEMQAELDRQRAGIGELLAHGAVPTREDARRARARRDEGWALVRATHVLGQTPDTSAFAGAEPLDRVYEAAVAAADAVVDQLLLDYARVSSHELAQARVRELETHMRDRRAEIGAVDAQAVAAETRWLATLGAAAIPPLAPAVLRDWQARLAALKPQAEAAAALRAERAQILEQQGRLVDKLRGPLRALGLTAIPADAPLDTLVAVGEENLRRLEALNQARMQAITRAALLLRQRQQHAARKADLDAACTEARARVDGLARAVLLAPGASAAAIDSRAAQFEALRQARESLAEAQGRRDTKLRLLALHERSAEAVAHTLAVPVPDQLTLAAGEWATRLVTAQQAAQARGAAERQAEAARALRAEHEAKIQRHRATLARLCQEAGVERAEELPGAEERSALARQTARDLANARALLSKASRRVRRDLDALLAGKDVEALRAEEAGLEGRLVDAGAKVAAARVQEEAARHALAAIDASGAAADAADAAARAAATVRQAHPLLMRTRLAHALLQEAVRRFKERTQAPMLVAASRYFAQITGGEFEGLLSDDGDARPVIKARRPGGAAVGVDALSEGTLDQLYLALRLAALELQRAGGADLPLILDDVLMTSDDARAACILKALAAFARGGQVIVFTHHAHLCEIARANVAGSELAVVELRRG